MKIQITQFSNFSRKVIVTAIFWHDRGKIMQSTSPIGQLCFENKIKRGCHSPLAPSKSSSGCDCKIFKTSLALKSLDVFVFGHLCISLGMYLGHSHTPCHTCHLKKVGRQTDCGQQRKSTILCLSRFTKCIKQTPLQIYLFHITFTFTWLCAPKL